MDIKKTLGANHNKKTVSQIVTYVGANPTRFKELVDIYLAGPYRITQRAAWPLSYCCKAHPKLAGPHLARLLKFVRKPDVHDAVKRNTVRLLQFIELPKKHQGTIAEICFDFLQNPKEPVAIRVFSMTVIARLAETNPELGRELRVIIEDGLPYGSAAFRSRGAKVLKALKKLGV